MVDEEEEEEEEEEEVLQVGFRLQHGLSVRATAGTEEGLESPRQQCQLEVRRRRYQLT